MQRIQHLIKLQPQRISLSLGIIAAQEQVRVLAFQPLCRVACISVSQMTSLQTLCLVAAKTCDLIRVPQFDDFRGQLLHFFRQLISQLARAILC